MEKYAGAGKPEIHQNGGLFRTQVLLRDRICHRMPQLQIDLESGTVDQLGYPCIQILNIN